MAARITTVAVGIVSLLFAFANAQDFVEFGYSGSLGPSSWGSLSPSYSLCSGGSQQSPIDIVLDDAEFDTDLLSLDRDYVPSNATLINMGFGVVLKFDEGVGTVFVEGQNYSLLQLHWHSPSEHTIDGERFPVELQLVHTSDDGNLAVVAILFQYGDSDPFFAKLMDKFGELASHETCSHDNEAHVAVGVIDMKAMRRSTRKYYRYVGSLTHPPCTENVIWSILGKVRDISKEQVQALQTALGSELNNSRPTQALNGRKVRYYSGAEVEELKSKNK